MQVGLSAEGQGNAHVRIDPYTVLVAACLAVFVISFPVAQRGLEALWDKYLVSVKSLAVLAWGKGPWASPPSG